MTESLQLTSDKHRSDVEESESELHLEGETCWEWRKRWVVVGWMEGAVGHVRLDPLRLSTPVRRCSRADALVRHSNCEIKKTPNCVF